MTKVIESGCWGPEFPRGPIFSMFRTESQPKTLTRPDRKGISTLSLPIGCATFTEPRNARMLSKESMFPNSSKTPVTSEEPALVSLSPSGLRPTNENRPNLCPSSTDSRRKPFRSPTKFTYRPTGVTASLTSSQQRGTMVPGTATSKNARRMASTSIPRSDNFISTAPTEYAMFREIRHEDPSHGA